MPTRAPTRPPAKKHPKRITDEFYHRMIANPDARIPFILTGRSFTLTDR